MSSEDGRDDIQEIGAAVGTRGGLCASCDARGLSTEQCSGTG
jgi:hypothetical protein